MQSLLVQQTSRLVCRKLNPSWTTLVFNLSSEVPVSESDAKPVEKKEKKVDPHKAILKKRYAENPAPLMEFFDSVDNWTEKTVRSGREWLTEELRIKSNEDLHKLWYVLLKERNMLMTMKYAAKEQKELFPNPERLDRVEQSMINIETVVRERNKAYMELEVGEAETAERPVVFRRNLFGIHEMVPCHEHLVPYWMNNSWRKLYGPGHGKYVREFVAKLREKKARIVAANNLLDQQEVRQLLRRFPNIDLDELQAKYPKVPVRYFKENLDIYNKDDYVEFSEHSFRKKRHFPYRV